MKAGLFSWYLSPSNIHQQRASLSLQHWSGATSFISDVIFHIYILNKKNWLFYQNFPQHQSWHQITSWLFILASPQDDVAFFFNFPFTLTLSLILYHQFFQDVLSVDKSRFAKYQQYSSPGYWCYTNTSLLSHYRLAINLTWLKCSTLQVLWQFLYLSWLRYCFTDEM